MRTQVAVPPGAIQHRSRLAADRATSQHTVAVLAAGTLLLAVAYGCVAQGGFYPAQQRTLFGLAVASGVLAALAAPARRVIAHLAIALPACACAIVVAVAAGDLGGAAPVLGILGAAASAALVARVASLELRDTLVSGLVVAGVALGVSGWIGVAFRHEPLALVDQGLWRASSTLTYANATAALLAPLAVVALARVAAAPDERRWRLASALLIVGVGATLSRAGWGALALGAAVLAWHLGWRKAQAALPTILGAGIATAGVIATAPARLPSHPAVAVAALLVGLTVALIPARRPRQWIVAFVLVTCAGIALAAASSSSRLTVSSPDRANEWRATWAVATAHPLAGVGPSRLNLEWQDGAGHTYAAHATHNEFLQLAAEQGFPALAIAVGTLTAVAVALVRRRRGVALAVLAAFAAASAFDFIWHVTLIPIVVAALIATAFPFEYEGARSA